MTLPKENLLAEFEDLQRSIPALEDMYGRQSDLADLLGRFLAAVSLWGMAHSINAQRAVNEINSNSTVSVKQGRLTMLTLIAQARHELRMQTLGPVSSAIGQGMVYDYFDEIRKVIEVAQEELFFIDPYLDAEFVSRYLPHVKSTVRVKLLASKKLDTLKPAVELITQQNNLTVEVRSIEGLHDRYFFVDSKACYQSGASFKDGAKKAPTTLTQILDIFPIMLATYEQKWESAQIV